LTKKLILKYLNPSLATAKGHIKQPRHGIKGTQPKLMPRATHPDQAVVIKPPHDIAAAPVHNVLLQQPLPHLIDDDGNESITSAFCQAHLQIVVWASYTSTSQEIFPSCHLTAIFATL
jgi:hypothetical protein